MKILVIEDNPKHQQSAIEMLAGHEITIITSFDEAMKVLEPKHDNKLAWRLLGEAGFPDWPDYDCDAETKAAFKQAKDKAFGTALIPSKYDVVLTDMMMPMSRNGLYSAAFDPRREVAYGLFIALKAAECGVRFVAMATDTNHHNGAESKALDHIQANGMSGQFEVNGARVRFYHAPLDSQERKDWEQILKNLLGETED